MELFFDGGCNPNPGVRTIGFVLKRQGVTLHRGRAVLPGVGTCNEAEYASLLLALKEAKRQGGGAVRIFGDSQLVVNHVNGKWKCRAPKLARMLEAVHQELAQLDWKIKWIAREQNVEADWLTRMGGSSQ